MREAREGLSDRQLALPMTLERHHGTARKQKRVSGVRHSGAAVLRAGSRAYDAAASGRWFFLFNDAGTIRLERRGGEPVWQRRGRLDDPALRAALLHTMPAGSRRDDLHKILARVDQAARILAQFDGEETGQGIRSRPEVSRGGPESSVKTCEPETPEEEICG
jgi:hypothetical protein